MSDNFSSYDFQPPAPKHGRHNYVFGIIILIIGVLLLFRKLGYLHWLIPMFVWPGIAILAGVLLGIKKNFRGNFWWILILIGSLNVLSDFEIFDRSADAFFIPAIMIVAGLVVILRHNKRKLTQGSVPQPIQSDIGYLNIDAVFSGRKEVVRTADFKGGNINVTFAGCELDLVKSSVSASGAVIELNVVFGSLELTVPDDWTLVIQVNPVFDNIEDKRAKHYTSSVQQFEKVLTLKGNCTFGNIEIKSY